MQQGMLFHSLYAPEPGAYFEQLSCTLRGDLDIPAFEQAWQRVAERHAVLRTSFVWKHLDKTLQVVHRRVTLPLEKQDWRGMSPVEQEARLEAYLQRERHRGFDLSQAPLIRLALMRTVEDAHYFVWSHHHILLDGWSLPLLLNEVFTLYEAFHRGQDLHLEPTRPYRDYIAWLQRQDLAEAEAFWRRTLAGFTAPTPLVVDRSPGSVAGQGEQYEMLETRLSAGTTAALQALARRHHLTLSTLVQGAWALLLSRYSGEEDVVFGATVSGRPADLSCVETMVGLFINTLPVRVQVPPEASVVDWLKRLQARLVQMRQYEYSPLVQIQEWSEVPRGSPLFESILVFENYPVGASLREQKGSLVVENIRSIEQTNYPLTVVSWPGETLSLKVSYDSRRFDADTIQRMLAHLGTLLEGMAADPEGSVSALPLLTEAERQQLLVAWNATATDYPRDATVHQLFEAQAAQTPDAVAVAFPSTGFAKHPKAPAERAGFGEGEQLTYQELNRRANQLAHYLRERGVGSETLVGICVERSLEMVVGLLGVLKAGGAYVPLDPTYPQERLAFMIEDAGVRVLLTQSHLLERLEIKRKTQNVTRNTLCLDIDWEQIAQESDQNPVTDPAASTGGGATPDNLAYVIYTSGSTGVPKGVMVPHRALVNHALAMMEVFGLGPGDRLLQFISLSFDASAEEIFPTLLGGATLVLSHPEVAITGADFLQLCEQQEITVLHLPASFWHQWVDELTAGELPVRVPLKTLLVGGEAPAVDRLKAWSHLVGRPIRFLNAYGPTEATITTTFYETVCDEEFTSGLSRIPIGRPIANVQTYLLDGQGRPVPIGVPGELHVGGAGVARSYLNRPELTAERFIPDPFAAPIPLPASGAPTTPSVPSLIGGGTGGVGTRLYKTGDLARYLPNGDLEFLGRVDHQVKVRGFRIELGEIEAVLEKHPALRSAVVLAREDQPGDRRLVAYVVPTAEATDQLDPSAVIGRPSAVVGRLRSYLKERLPDYMLPSTFVVLEALPLLPSGKVDRRALPAPEGTRPDLEVAYAAPRTPVEEVLVELWARVLGVERVGLHDDFFELGGHSLLAVRLISRLRRAFQVELPLQDLFEAPTVAGLAERVEAALRAAAGLESPPIKPAPRDGELPLSFAQQRLWFLDQLAPANLFYNIPMAVRLTGRLDVEALERSLNEILRRHEVLRTTFRAEGGRPVQIIAPELSLTLSVEDLSRLPEAEREAEARRWMQEETRRPFDLARGPLLRAKLLKLGEEEHVAVLTMHHIISDGWSMEVLIREVAILYEAFSQGRPSPLPELSIQYADFACWQRGWLQGEVLERQLAYWKEQLKDRPLMLDLPTDRPRPAVQSWRGATEKFALPLELSRKLRTLSREEGATLFMTLLAAFQTLLYRYTGQEDISVGTAIANRNRAEIEGLIGFFVNTLVMRTNLSGEPSFREVLKRARKVALEAYAHQDLPFEILVEALQPERDLSHTPLFQTAFALQNAPMEALELPGLTLTPLDVDTGTAKFDLMLVMAERPDGLSGVVEYNTDLFDTATIRRMVGHFQTLLTGIVSDPEQPISHLPLLTEREQQQLLVDWNATALATPMDRCAHELFEAQVARRPEAVAVTFEGQMLTYRELNRRANQLAHYLQKLGVGPEVLVGISTDRSPETMVGILGVLKAGGAYLPLDPTYPQERLAFMLEDAGVTVLLTQAHLRERLPAHQAQVVHLDADWGIIAQEPDEKPQSGVTPENLAYVIYTSGSTGVPKGTMLGHRGLSNLAEAQRQAFGIREGSRVLQFSPLSFDASVWETFMALANGATLCLARQEVLASGRELVRLLQEEGVTNVTLPPSVLSALGVPAEALPQLETVISAGEACSAELVARWAPGRDFFNAYGPTETTVCASMYLCDEEDSEAPPIGQPIANTALYVLDKNLQPVPIGVPGELHVGGVGLARGYLNRPDLTTERFIPNPFATPAHPSLAGRGRGRVESRPEAGSSSGVPAPTPPSIPPLSGGAWGGIDVPLSGGGVGRVEAGDRLYKTGDLVRYRADGNLEFLGRIDHQVKVRGFRIELGEIEAILEQHPGVADGVVVAREDIPGDKRLVAYVVPKDDEGRKMEDESAPSLVPRPSSLVGGLRTFLKEKLPDYMVPSAFIFLDALPLSPSGKVDRQALPAPDGARPTLEREYVPPRTPVENELAEICSELLGVNRVGVYDSFFELGGHSLLATQFISRVREAFDVEVSLRTLFEHPTVAELAERIERLRQTEPAQGDKIAEILEKVKHLSEDEVMALLHEKQM